MKKNLIIVTSLTVLLSGIFLLMRSQSNEDKKKSSEASNDAITKSSEDRGQKQSLPEIALGPGGWEKAQQVLQAQLELPQDIVPWGEIETAIFQLLDTDETRTLELLTGLEGEVNLFVLQLILKDYYKQDKWDDQKPLRALETLQKNPSLSANLVEEFVSEYAQDHRQAAEDWVLSRPAMEGTGSAALALGRMAGEGKDVQAAFEKMAQPDLPKVLSSNYLMGLVSTWAEQDLEGALLYLSQTDLSPETDPAVYNVIPHIKELHPENTMAWASIIQDEGLRHSAIIETAHAWSQDDYPSYSEWKNSTTLPEPTLRELP